MTRRWQYAKSMYDRAVASHGKRSGWESMMGQEVVKDLRRLKKTKRKAA